MRSLAAGLTPQAAVPAPPQLSGPLRAGRTDRTSRSRPISAKYRPWRGPGARIDAVAPLMHKRSPSAALKSRSTKSGAGRLSASRRVVFAERRRLAPSMPACFINRATRLFPTRSPCARNSAWMRGRPVHRLSRDATKNRLSGPRDGCVNRVPDPRIRWSG